MDKLKVVAEALLEIETLDGEQFEKLYSGEMTAEELVKDVEQRDSDIRKANEEEAREAEAIQKTIEEAERRSRELAEKAARMHEVDDLPPFYRRGDSSIFDEQELKKKARDYREEDDLPDDPDDA